ncbi:MAG: gamma-glutamyltransferase [Acidimicrobiaceae bacterium]|nr:gamma-glutamyltransferase [Acidimicrobiaceae bacterium]
MATGFTTRPTLRGSFGMVSSTHWLASASAMAVLEEGGNAFDAAVAAGFVLHVVEPHLCGPGGEVPAIISNAADPHPSVLAGQGPAPAGATIEHFESLGLGLVPGAGPLAAAVPGAFDAWMLLLRDRGTMSLRSVLRFAIDYAGGGHPIGAGPVATIATVERMFREDWTTSGELWLPGGRLPSVGSRFVNGAWATTLERLVTEAESHGNDRERQIEAARQIWRQGFVAEAIDAFARVPFRDSSGGRHPGVLTGADLAAWSASWERPTTFDWRGYTVAKVPPWGQGPVLLQTLALLDAAASGDVPDPSTAEGAHLAVECLKLAMADREAWYGDGADVPMATLLSAAYNRERARLVGSEASAELRPGRPDERTPRIGAYALEAFAPSAAEKAGWTTRESALNLGVVGDPTLGTDLAGATGEPTLATGAGAGGGRARAVTSGEPAVDADGVTRGDTVHVDVVDRWGNMISATPSGGWLQSSPTIPALGFCLGSRLQMTWLERGLPSSLTPGRRPRTTLTPTLVLRDGEPVLACGTPGGDQQDQWQLLFLLRYLGAGMELQEAIDAPSWHTDSFPASFYPRRAEPANLVVEDRLGEQVLAELARRGHRIMSAGPWSLGRLCAVARDPESGFLSAAANPRGMQGYAAGR